MSFTLLLLRLAKYCRDENEQVQSDIRSSTQIHLVASDMKAILYEVGPLLLDDLALEIQRHDQHISELAKALCPLCSYR